MGQYTTGNLCKVCGLRLLHEHNMEFAEFSCQAGVGSCVVCGIECGHVWAGISSTHAHGSLISYPEDCIPRLRQKLGIADGV